ncbi:MAG: DUF4304 domain-containing protein [Hyphomicrobiales bacterium]
MMRTSKKIALEAIIGEVLAPLGFAPSGKGYWYRSHDGLVDIVNVQGSSYSSVRYINLGICLASLLDGKRPATADFHVTTRIGHFIEKRNVPENLDVSELPASFNTQERSQIASLIEEGVRTFFRYSQSQSALKEALINGAFEGRALALLPLKDKLL